MREDVYNTVAAVETAEPDDKTIRDKPNSKYTLPSIPVLCFHPVPLQMINWATLSIIMKGQVKTVKATHD